MIFPQKVINSGDLVKNLTVASFPCWKFLVVNGSKSMAILGTFPDFDSLGLLVCYRGTNSLKLSVEKPFVAIS